MTDHELMLLACKAREMAYAPYSHFCVGAALLGESGRVYTGCNVENAAFTPTNCAERTAVFKAVSEGERRFVAIAVTGGKEGEAPDAVVTPCGVCRQVLAEFCAGDLRVVLGNAEKAETVSLSDLLPRAFGGEML